MATHPTVALTDEHKAGNAGEAAAHTGGFRLRRRSSDQSYSHQPMSQQGHESSDEEVYDPVSEGPYDDRGIDDPDYDLPEVYEHVHTKDAVEFQLIPHHQDPDKWKIYFPIVFWFPRYRWKEWFPYDLIAAITAIVMVIPQGMGYALVAGLQPIYGLYSALLGHCLYGPFGTSGQLIVAPVAIVSLMTKETLHAFDEHVFLDDPVKYAAYGSALAFQVGIISLLLGLCKAGILANMLAEPVIVGFTFAAAILIGMSQLTFVFQIDVEGEELIVKLINFFEHIDQAHALSILLAVCCIFFLLIIKFWKDETLCCKYMPGAKYAKFIPSALILVVVTTSISSQMGESTGWDIVGELPKGLPSFLNFFQYIEGDDFWQLFISSLFITILAFIESIAVATKFADKHDYSVDASQELIALGICNLVGCWFQIYPVSGVLSLATVVEAAGALTPLYSIIAGCGMIICTAFLLSLFEWLPKPVLGSIVLVGIINLVDIHKMKEIWKVNRRDFLVMSITILVTLFLGIDYGVALGVVVSVMLFVQRAAKPHYGVLGKLPDETINVYRNIKHFPTAETREDLLIIRWDASIFFANAQSFKTRIRKHIGRHLNKHNYPKRWCLVLCFSGVNDIDFSGAEMLKAFFMELKEKEKGMSLVLCKLKTQVTDILRKADILPIIGEDHVLWELHSAEEWWSRRLKMMKQKSFDGRRKMEAQRSANSEINMEESALLKQQAPTKTRLGKQHSEIESKNQESTQLQPQTQLPDVQENIEENMDQSSDTDSSVIEVLKNQNEPLNENNQ